MQSVKALPVQDRISLHAYWNCNTVSHIMKHELNILKQKTLLKRNSCLESEIPSTPPPNLHFSCYLSAVEMCSTDSEMIAVPKHIK